MHQACAPLMILTNMGLHQLRGSQTLQCSHPAQGARRGSLYPSLLCPKEPSHIPLLLLSHHESGDPTRLGGQARTDASSTEKNSTDLKDH